MGETEGLEKGLYHQPFFHQIVKVRQRVRPPSRFRNDPCAQCHQPLCEGTYLSRLDSKSRMDFSPGLAHLCREGALCMAHPTACGVVLTTDQQVVVGDSVHDHFLSPGRLVLHSNTPRLG